MNKKQTAALSTLAYLDRPDGVTTLGEFVEYYIKHPEKLPEKEQERHKFEKAIGIVKSDSYLSNLKIVGYTNNNNTGTKSGFVGYAFAETTSSKDGVVSFRGSENPFDGNWNDWLNNLEMETNPSSKQMEDAIRFMHNPKKDEGAGNLTSIQTVGHSLGGFLAGTQAILDPRVTSAITFNAPGVPESFINKNKELMISENLNKINAYSTSGDLVSKLGSPLVLPNIVSGSFDLLKAHSMDNFLEGDETMENVEIIENLQEIFPEKIAEIINFLALLGDEANMFLDESLPEFVEKVTTFFSELPGKIAEFFNQIITDVTTWAGNMIVKAEEEVPKFIESVRVFFSELPGKVGEFFNQIITDITTWVSNLITTAAEEVPKFIENMVTFFSELPERIWEFLSQAVGKLVEWASGLISKAGEVLPGVISSVVGFFSGLPGQMLSVGTNMVQGIFNGISNSIQWLYGMLKGWVSNVISYIKGLFGIHSPSAIMRDEVGKNLALGIAEGITKNKDAVSDAMSEMADVVADSDISVEPEVSAKSIGLEAFKEKIRPSLDYIKSQVSRAQDAMTAQFSASAQLVAARTCATMESVYNKTTNFNNNYNITAANNSPKATADAIKNQMTMQRMLFATR